MDAFCKFLDTVEKPQFSGEKSHQEIRSLLQEIPLFRETKISFKDAHYTSTSRKYLTSAFEKLRIKDLKFRSECFDCDDFSLLARTTLSLLFKDCLPDNRAFSFAVITGDIRLGNRNAAYPHTMNLFLECSGRFYLYEPQKNQFYELSSLSPNSRITEILF